MRHPFQCVAQAEPRPGVNVLLAASASVLYSYDLVHGEKISKWPESLVREESEGSHSSTEIITTPSEDKRGVKRRKKVLSQDVVTPDITILRVSSDQQNIVAVTGSDKFVHVLSIGDDGKLHHLSRRQMTKRPCAIEFDSHGDSILVGDKFGDVYSLPIAADNTEEATMGLKKSGNDNKKQRVFKPSATELTVHTLGNLKALEAQRLAPTQNRTLKEAMNFSHELLLGHVSMLTDVASITINVPILSDSSESPEYSTRHYLITADRDEHIRVSRGRPQTYIIESYCFGHTQFVNKLCHPHSKILVSGGGDDFLIAWDWQKSEIICKIDLRTAVAQLKVAKSKQRAPAGLQSSIDTTSNEVGDESQETSEDTLNQARLAVSGLWVPRDALENVKPNIDIFCACEGVPAIFHFWQTFEDHVDEIVSLRHRGFQLDLLPLHGNAVNVAASKTQIIVSIDNIHSPGSIEKVKDRITEPLGNLSNRRLYGFKFSDVTNFGKNQLEACSKLQNQLDKFEAMLVGHDNELLEGNMQHARDLIYGAEKLRKYNSDD